MRLMRQSFLATIILVFILSVAQLAAWIRGERKTKVQQQEQQQLRDAAITAANTVSSLRAIPEQQERRSAAPKVVILPGPHKTGTTGVQTCLLHWSVQNDLIPPWRWAIPNDRDMMAANLRPLIKQKQFAPLLAVLRKTPVFALNKKHHPMFDKEKTLEVYRKRFEIAHINKRKIVYGAEAMDFIVSSRHDGAAILDGVLDVIPESLLQSNNGTDIEVAVNYRTPRWKHLVSVWHEQGRADTPLSEFLTGPQFLYIFQTNALALALRFQERGLPTTIIDMSGVTENRLHMCQVIACDVLQVECNDDYQVLSLLEHETPSNMNSKKGKAEMDLSPQQLADIDKIMNAYDCGLRDSILQYKPRILFQKDLFSSCNQEAPEKSFTWMVQAIQKVVNNAS